MPTADPPSSADPPTSAYWRQTLRLSRWLLLLWFGLTFGIGLFGQRLDLRLFGWPVGFWLTSQGALLGYCLIVWCYAWAMNRLDRAERADGDD